MNLLGMMLGAVNKQFEWVYAIADVLNSALWPILIVVAAAGTIYAVVLGVNMARADSTEKREDAKKRVINVLIGMAIIVGLILLLQLFSSLIVDGTFFDVTKPIDPDAGQTFINVLRK